MSGKLFWKSYWLNSLTHLHPRLLLAAPRQPGLGGFVMGRLVKLISRRLQELWNFFAQVSFKLWIFGRQWLHDFEQFFEGPQFDVVQIHVLSLDETSISGTKLIEQVALTEIPQEELVRIISKNFQIPPTSCTMLSNFLSYRELSWWRLGLFTSDVTSSFASNSAPNSNH